MTTHCADHAWLQVVEDRVIRETADVQFGVMMTARIGATVDPPSNQGLTVSDVAFRFAFLMAAYFRSFQLPTKQASESLGRCFGFLRPLK
jgi:hypothetical protein